MEHLDLSYKSNALVAKVFPSLNHVASSSDGKGVVSRSLKKKIVKKKVVKPRDKVVPVSLNASTSGVSEVVPKKPLVSGSPIKYSNKELERTLVSTTVVPESLKASGSRASKEVHKRSLVSRSSGKLSSKLTEKVVVSSAVVPCSSSAKPGPKKVKLIGSAGKSSVKISAKSKPSVEVQKKEITRCLDTFNSEIKTKSKDDGASNVCCQELTKEMKPTENNVTVQSNEIISIGELSSGEVIGGDENKAIGEKVHGICADDTVVSGAEILDGVHSDGNLNTSHSGGKNLNGLSLEQGTTGTMLPHTDGGVEGSAQVITAAEHGASKGPCEELACRMSDVESSANFVIGLGEHFNDAHPLTLEDGEQIIPPADSLKGEAIIQKVEDERLVLDVCVHTEDAKLLEGSGSQSCGVVLNSHADDISTPLPLKASEIDSESVQPLGARDCAPSMLEMEGMQQQCDHFNLVDTKAVAVASYADKSIKDLVHSQVSDMDSLTVVYDAQDVGCPVDAELSDSCFSDLKLCNDDKDNSNQEEQLTTWDDSSVVSVRHLPSEAEEVKSTGIMPCHEEISELLQEGLSQGSTKHTAPVLGSCRGGRVYEQEGLAGNSSHLNRNLRNKTWHRTESTASALLLHGNLHSTSRLLGKQSSKKPERVHNSYIRKGNSLIRKSLPVQQPPQLKLAENGENIVQKLSSKGFDGKTDAARHPTSNPSFVTKTTPNLPLQINSPSLSSNLPEDDTHDISEALTSEGGFETQVKQPKSQIADLVLGSNVDGQSIQPIRKSEPFDSKKIRYVKRKSNQLVAAPKPDSGDLSTHTIDKVLKVSSCAPSDLYYRKKKNQLIRNASCDLQKQDATSPADNSISDDQRIPIISSLKASTRGPFKKRLDKVLQKKYKHASLVWTLAGEESQKKGFSSVNSWKVLPSLFPWKRAIYWKSSSNIPCTSNKSSLSLISRRLQLTRRRNTVYTVSTDGFSIRKAGVISIGGSSLKWSKSIERQTKKASEEATLAVAEVERMKRERKRAAHLRPNKKNGNCLLRERIFRVGSARYKMDPSKRTLIRISDNKMTSLSLAADQQGVNRLRSFVPRRLLIGNDEYIRIGNGNQLVRDPKKLIRILASEKVRWSLHTARLKLAKKQQYCQFFTRFGKCNKNGGKCPYIHDPTKIAICTKFLRGLCSNANCKLTHKVQPERMPDCSYFLRGLCTNMNCPYRHVNVNPKAVVCEGFLKGYCADGDECCKKHSYVCPVFEATGKCPQGSKCKLHHPKSINKTKKRKQTTIQISSNKRRYFGSSITEAVKPLNVVHDKKVVEGRDLFCCDGQFTDFISLDANSDEDGAEVTVSMDSHAMPCDSELSDQQPEDVEALIKPVHLLYTTKLTTLSADP
ncbi:putative transcription factor C3H family [Dioscorea sansibarensis]